MNQLSFTLLSDGSSDRCLLPIVRWTIAEALRGHDCQQLPQWADLRSLPHPPKLLADRIRVAVDLFPCQLLLVHRDAERQDVEVREQEIAEALAEFTDCNLPPSVKLIPVRMQETWLLIQEQAIREAAGNPHGTVPINLPRISRLESLNAKQTLHDALITASELNGRRLRNFSPQARSHQVAEFIDDFSLLRHLPAFQTFESDLKQALQSLNLL